MTNGAANDQANGERRGEWRTARRMANGAANDETNGERRGEWRTARRTLNSEPRFAEPFAIRCCFSIFIEKPQQMANGPTNRGSLFNVRRAVLHSLRRFLFICSNVLYGGSERTG